MICVDGVCTIDTNRSTFNVVLFTRWLEVYVQNVSRCIVYLFFFLNDPPPTEISPLPQHASLPIPPRRHADDPGRHAVGIEGILIRPVVPRREHDGDALVVHLLRGLVDRVLGIERSARPPGVVRSEEHTSELQSLAYLVCRLLLEKK